MRLSGVRFSEAAQRLTCENRSAVKIRYIARGPSVVAIEGHWRHGRWSGRLAPQGLRHPPRGVLRQLLHHVCAVHRHRAASGPAAASPPSGRRPAEAAGSPRCAGCRASARRARRPGGAAASRPPSRLREDVSRTVLPRVQPVGCRRRSGALVAMEGAATVSAASSCRSQLGLTPAPAAAWTSTPCAGGPAGRADAGVWAAAWCLAPVCDERRPARRPARLAQFSNAVVN